MPRCKDCPWLKIGKTSASWLPTVFNFDQLSPACPPGWWRVWWVSSSIPPYHLRLDSKTAKLRCQRKKEATRSNKKPKWIAKPKQRFSKVQKSFQKDLPENRCTLPTDLLTDVVSKVASLLDSVALDVIKGDVTWQPRWHCPLPDVAA